MRIVNKNGTYLALGTDVAGYLKVDGDARLWGLAAGLPARSTSGTCL